MALWAHREVTQRGGQCKKCRWMYQWGHLNVILVITLTYYNFCFYKPTAKKFQLWIIATNSVAIISLQKNQSLLDPCCKFQFKTLWITPMVKLQVLLQPPIQVHVWNTAKQVVACCLTKVYFVKCDVIRLMIPSSVTQADTSAQQCFLIKRWS